MYPMGRVTVTQPNPPPTVTAVTPQDKKQLIATGVDESFWQDSYGVVAWRGRLAWLAGWLALKLESKF